MKKTILISATVISFFTISIIGCKKETSHVDTVQDLNSSQRVGTLENIRVSPYGFLVFPHLEDFNVYIPFLKATHKPKCSNFLTV